MLGPFSVFSWLLLDMLMVLLLACCAPSPCLLPGGDSSTKPKEPNANIIKAVLYALAGDHETGDSKLRAAGMEPRVIEEQLEFFKGLGSMGTIEASGAEVWFKKTVPATAQELQELRVKCGKLDLRLNQLLADKLLPEGLRGQAGGGGAAAAAVVAGVAPAAGVAGAEVAAGGQGGAGGAQGGAGGAAAAPAGGGYISDPL